MVNIQKIINESKSAKKEYVCMEETVQNTQKKIRQWLSSGYIIDILFQFITENGLIVTSLYRIK